MFFRNALAYSGTNVISQFFVFIQGFVLRMLLPPEIIGIWNYIKVVKSFISQFQIGLLSGALRQLSILHGSGRREGQFGCRSVSLTYSIFEVIAIAACVVVYIFVKKGSLSFTDGIALIIGAVLLVFTRFQDVYTAFFQGAQLYIPLSRTLLINSLLYAMALIIGAYWFGIWGLIGAAIITEGLKSFLMFFVANKCDLKAVVKWDLNMFKGLASYSVNMRVMEVPLGFFYLMDTLWITKFMDVRYLAIYAVARGFYSQTSDITTRIGTVFSTRILSQYGREADGDQIGKDLNLFVKAQLLLMIPMICWTMFSVMPFLVRQITPLYIECILPMLILLLANFFDMKNNNLVVKWIAEKRLREYGKANLFSFISLFFSISLSWFVIGDRTLIGISISVLIGYFIGFIYIIFSAGKEIFGVNSAIKLLMQVTVTAAWVGIVIIYLSKDTQMSLRDDLFFSLKQSVIGLVLIMPIILFNLKTTGVGKVLYRKFAEFKRQRLSLH